MRLQAEAVTITLPVTFRSIISRIAFPLEFRGRRLRVEVGRTSATYTLVRGEPLEVVHHGESFLLTGDGPATRDVPALPHRPAPAQPPGRAPHRRVQRPG